VGRADPLGWDFAVPDWKERLLAGSSLMPPLPLDPVAAARAIAIFNKLRLPDVDGQPEMREAAGDWFRDLVGAIHGSIDATGLRHVRDVSVLVPKKNAKTTNGAGLMLTSLLVDDEPNQFYGLYGPTQEIAERGFAQARGMIEADREGVLQARFHVMDHLKTIRDRKTKSILKVSTFDEKVATGVIPKGFLVDELHILGKVAYANRVLGQLRGGLMARPGGFMVKITTQSDQPPAGVWKAELELARAIRDGRVKGIAATVLPLLYEFPEEFQKDPAEPWADPATWSRVLPNLGRSLRLDLLEADFETARVKGLEEVQRWCSQHLNIQIGLALAGDRWDAADYWEGAVDPLLDLDELLRRAEVATIGIDGGGLDDLLGVAVVGRCRETRRWLVWVHAWAHPEVFERRKSIASTLQGFVDDGDLTICAGPTDDIDGVVKVCVRVREAGVLADHAGIGLDPFGVAVLIDALAEAGFTYGEGRTDLEPVGQGYRLNGMVRGLPRKLKDGTLIHGGQRLLAWCVANSKAEQKGNNLVITKQAAGISKIDPVIALLVASMCMARNPVPGGAGRSFWEAEAA
jgi:phage terminase large subunit-like protein